MRIGIIGAGNEESALAAYLANGYNDVTIYSSKPNLWNGVLEYTDSVTKKRFISHKFEVTNEYKRAVQDKDLVICALPTFMINRTIDQFIDYLDEETLVGFAPGAGGVEFLARKLIERHITIFGFDRVPFVSRLHEYGKSVSASLKQSVRISTIPKAAAGKVQNLLRELLQIRIGQIELFLNITLTPTLHISRAYDLYGKSESDGIWNRNIYFYREWTDTASELCFALDAELHEICDYLTEHELDCSAVVPYKIHYESETPKALTSKLRSIISLNDIKSPMIYTEAGWKIDWDSRYFTESIPNRLCIVKGLGMICGIETKLADEILLWYEKAVGKQYFKRDENGSWVSGIDIRECTAPQAYGIYTLEQLQNYYI